MSTTSASPYFGQPAEAWLSRGGVTANGMRYGPPGSAIAWGMQGCPLLPRVIRSEGKRFRLPCQFDRVFGASLTVDQLDSIALHRLNVSEISELVRRAFRDFLYGLPSPHGWVAIPAGIPLLWLEALPINGRTRNAVRRAFNGSAADSCFSEPLLAGQFVASKSVGMMALNELTCVIESAELDQAGDEQLVELESLPDSKTFENLVNVAALQLIESISPATGYLNAFAKWAMAETGARTVGDAITELMGSSIENEEWNAMASVRLSDLAALPQHPYAVLDAWAEQLDCRTRAVLRERISRSHSNQTLQELADSFGVTRERMRQVEVRTRHQLKSILAGGEGFPLRWRAKTLRHILGVAGPEARVEHLLKAPLGCRDYRTVLFEMAGPYDLDHGWLILQSARDTDPTPTILNQVDEVGRIDDELAHLQLSEWGLDASLHEDWLARDSTLRLFNGQLVRWGTSIPDRLVFALADLGCPATIDDLMSHIEEKGSRNSVVNSLGTDPRLVRVNQTHWALTSWDLPEYTGVAYSMRSLLEETGESVTIDGMIQRMSQTFGVSENTTRAYCFSPMFVVDGESLRLRTAADGPFRSDLDSIWRTPGVFYLGPGRVGRLFKVDSNILRGSGNMLTHAAGTRSFRWRLIKISPSRISMATL